MNFSSRLSRSSRTSGFTLVELLVVIGIIAILAAVVTVAAGAAINSAKRAKANVLANQIETAVLNYNTEYGVYPVPTTASGTDVYYPNTDNSDWSNLMIALCGNINPLTPNSVATSTVPNTRSIPYLTPNRKDVDSTTGIIKTPFPDPTTGGSEYFFIAIDSDYDGVLGGKSPTTGVIPNFSAVTSPSTSTAIPFVTTGITAGCAVWSNCNQPATGNSIANYWVHTY